MVNHRTESAHEQPSGVTVTTCPLTTVPSSEVISFSQIYKSNADSGEQGKSSTRYLGNTRPARGLGDMILGGGMATEECGWAGGWCWDGLVLLEGCEVSAMRIARAFGVNVPWEVAKIM